MFFYVYIFYFMLYELSLCSFHALVACLFVLCSAVMLWCTAALGFGRCSIGLANIVVTALALHASLYAIA